MKLVIYILVGFFVIVAVLYMFALGGNDIGYILAVIVGAAGSVMALGLSPIRFAGMKTLGVGMIGLALFFLIANLFGVPLV